MDFPHPFKPDPTHRAGRMMDAGRVKVTVTSGKSGEHITILFKAIADNRNRQYDEDNTSNWVPCPLRDATHLFAEVPNQSGWNDKVGTYYPNTGRWYDADNADQSRVWAAQAAMWWISDAHWADLLETTFQEASECGVCGRELTDPESIALGIGPVCLGRQTGSQHQVKDLSAHREAKEESQRELFNAENPHGDAEREEPLGLAGDTSEDVGTHPDATTGGRIIDHKIIGDLQPPDVREHVANNQAINVDVRDLKDEDLWLLLTACVAEKNARERKELLGR